MTLVVWLAVLTVICIGIARYYEDDSLFWKLYVSFVGAYIAASVVKATLENNQEKVTVVESIPTQALESTSGIAEFRLADVSLSATSGEKSPKPVGKDYITLNNRNSLLSKVFGSARGQPQMCMYYDDS